jgi:mono/diheme cytochrome c family protein
MNLETTLKIFDNLPAVLIVTVLVAGVGVMVWKAVRTPDQAAAVPVTMPALSALAKAGQQVFATNCTACHGQNGAGSENGPPLVHDIYNPGHHDDGSFYRAAQRGVRQHHWRFGNMEPVPQVSNEKMKAIIRYIRELQVANGITYKPHRM